MLHLEADKMMSELGSKGVEMEVTQPAWPTSSPRCTRLSAILDYHSSSFTVGGVTASLLHLAAGWCSIPYRALR